MLKYQKIIKYYQTKMKRMIIRLDLKINWTQEKFQCIIFLKKIRNNIK